MLRKARADRQSISSSRPSNLPIVVAERDATAKFLQRQLMMVLRTRTSPCRKSVPCSSGLLLDCPLQEPLDRRNSKRQLTRISNWAKILRACRTRLGAWQAAIFESAKPERYRELETSLSALGDSLATFLFLFQQTDGLPTCSGAQPGPRCPHVKSGKQHSDSKAIPYSGLGRKVPRAHVKRDALARTSGTLASSCRPAHGKTFAGDARRKLHLNADRE
jgi:hypothetical protein